MNEFTFAILSILIGITGALATTLCFAGTLHIATRKSDGYLHISVLAILFSSAIAIGFSGRDFTLGASNTLEMMSVTRQPVDAWVQRICSVAILLAAIERVLNHLIHRQSLNKSPPLLLPAYIVFWTFTVATTAMFSAVPKVSHEYTYTLIIGIAAILVSARESQKILKTARNSLLIFLIASLVSIGFFPKIVIDYSYTQGVIPGLPRLAGLAPHAVTMALLAQIELLLIWVIPFKRPRITKVTLAISLFVIFLAQSKTAWISVIPSALALIFVRSGETIRRRLLDPARPEFSIFIILFGIILITALSTFLLLGNFGNDLDRFLASGEGAQLTSLTGRDTIWHIAFQEWLRNPIFGYGPHLFDEAYRMSVGLFNATHAHNEFFDVLARSGSVGAIALIGYTIVLIWLSIRYAKPSAGLSIGLLITLMVRAISEVPMALFSYGPETLLHFLLLICIAGTSRKSSQPVTYQKSESITNLTNNLAFRINK